MPQRGNSRISTLGRLPQSLRPAIFSSLAFLVQTLVHLCSFADNSVQAERSAVLQLGSRRLRVSAVNFILVAALLRCELDFGCLSSELTQTEMAAPRLLPSWRLDRLPVRSCDFQAGPG